MNIYKDMYFELFNKITDVIEELQQIQIAVEKMYIYSRYTESKVSSNMRVEDIDKNKKDLNISNCDNKGTTISNEHI